MRIEMAKAFTKKAAEIAMRHFKRTEGRKKLGNQGIVTDADAEIEEFVKQRIRDTYPAERILGEETGFSKPAPPASPPATAADDILTRLGGLPKKKTVKELFQDMPQAEKPATPPGEGVDVLWAIDPIDGTSAFAAGLPIWAISVGVMIGGIPAVGVMSMPGVNELYWGDESGVFLNGARVRLREGTDQFDSETALMVPSNSHRKYLIDYPGKTRSMGSLAAHMAYVAAGAADAALLGRPHLWDIAGGAAMIFHQGGVILTLSGAACDWAPMMAGERPPEPLICGPEKTIRAMMPHIKIRAPVDY